MIFRRTLKSSPIIHWVSSVQKRFQQIKLAAEFGQQSELFSLAVGKFWLKIIKQKDSFSFHFTNNFAGFVLFEIQFYETSETIPNYLANAWAFDFVMWTN